MFSRDALLGLINSQNNPATPVSADNVEFTNVTALDAGVRTKATVVAKPNTVYVGSVDIFYNRINLSAIVDGTGLLSATPFTVDMILQKLADNWNAFLTVDDLEPFSIPDTSDGEIHDIPLVAAANSPICVGSVMISLDQTDTAPLNTLLNTTMPAGYL